MNKRTNNPKTTAASSRRPERASLILQDENTDAGATDLSASGIAASSIHELQQINAEIEGAVDAHVVKHLAIEKLKPDPRNARLHPERQIDLLAASMRQFGFIGVIVIDEDFMVISGHGRLEAAKRIRMGTVPCIQVTHLTAEAKTALALADNRLAELSQWHEPSLVLQLEELSASELDFDIEITGFDTVDLDRLLGPEPDLHFGKSASGDYSKNPDDDVPPPREDRPPVSKLGDLWLLGDHRVFHGDALDPMSYAALMDGASATQVVTDPPYNVRTRGHVSSKGFREFQMAAGEMSKAGFMEFLGRALSLCRDHSVDGAILHVFQDWRHMEELLGASAVAGLTVKNLCVWAKPSAGMGSFYRSQHELVFVLKHGDAKHINNFGLGARGRSRANVWKYPAVRGHRKGVNGPEEGHPTVKPVTLIMDAIRDCSRRRDIILDPFGGSGTTLIAAERVGRIARLIEIDGHYIDLTIRRWQAVTKGVATRAADGRPFDALEAENPGSVDPAEIV